MAPIVGVSPVGTDVHDAAASILEQGTNLSLWTLPAMIAMEISIGAVIGFGASLPMIGFQMSGRVVDQQLGLGLAGVFNPELDEQAGVIGQFYFMFALALFIIMGGHHVLLSILIGSFNTVPLGGFGASSDLLSMLLGLLAIMFELALRVAGPLLCLVFLETAAIGFIARTVPQMNILSIGFPVRILVGVGLLITAIGIEAEVYMDSVQRTLHELATFFGS
jgi:flagellar biosynthetic protein FliR